MAKIGGNVEAILQEKRATGYNEIGEATQEWAEIQRLWGFLDFSGGQASYSYDAKLQDTTHVFICDYSAINRKAENKRLVVNGNAYDVLLIDDPMELHQQLEFNLKLMG